MISQSQLKNYSYELNDQAWLKYLHENGYAVVKNVLSKEEVEKAINLFWEWLQSLGSGIKRDDPSTWVDQNWPGSGSMGFFVSYGGCHTQASWFLRTRPQVKNIFAKIWDTNSLITSFDTMICWRPWWNKFSKNNWDPYVQNLHIDQNPYFKKGFHCVQGMIPLVDVRSDGVGGLQIVPCTNNDKTQEQLTKRYKMVTFGQSDWLQLAHSDPYIGKGHLLCCNAGDMILWDSRTIHGGKINKPSQQFMIEHQNKLVRLAMTVTMVPRLYEKVSVKQKRKNAFLNRIGLTHWPQQYNKSGFGISSKNIKWDKIEYKWPQLTPQIEDLI